MCLTLTCDVRVSHPDAKLGFNFSKLGIHPGENVLFSISNQIMIVYAASLGYNSR